MIEVRSLTRYYGSFPAVRDVSFTIDERVIVGFLGLNGAGKSTVLKVLGGLLPPSAGQVRVGGVDVMEAPDSLRKRIGYLPEEPPLYREMRVAEFLRWCGELKGVPSRELDDRLREVMALCHIDDVADRIIDDLSHGYRKRVGIAQAIIHRPELVILDEPISGLDPVQIVEMRQVLRNLRGSCTILVSSHILSEISQTCDRLLVLHRGRIVAEGTEAELADRMRSDARVVLVVRGAREKLEEVLDGSDFVESFEILPSDGDTVRARVLLTGDERERLVAAVVQHGLGLRLLEEPEGELESVFLGLTRERATSGAGRDGVDGAPDDATPVQRQEGA